MKKPKYFEITQSEIKKGFITHKDQTDDNLSFSIIKDLLIIDNEDDDKGKANLDKWGSGKKKYKEFQKKDFDDYVQKNSDLRKQEIEKEPTLKKKK